MTINNHVEFILKISPEFINKQSLAMLLWVGPALFFFTGATPPKKQQQCSEGMSHVPSFVSWGVGGDSYTFICLLDGVTNANLAVEIST